MRIAALILMLGSLARAGCLAVPADRITAADLAAALPVFQTLEPATPFGFAPFPGTQRIVSVHDLILFAQQHSLPSDGITASLCIERVVQPISSTDLKSAMLAAIGIPEANLELLEFSSQPVPPGRFEFKRSGLGTPVPADAPVIWRGRLLYDGQHSISIWAKVRVTVTARRFVAAEAIAAGTVIRADQVKEIESPQFPFSEPAPAAIGDIAGKVARRSLAAGEKIVTRSLDQPKDVRPGETVHVQVLDGAMALSFDAVAEGGGRAGDSIWVHNPAGGKKFRAVIEKQGKVVVRPTSGD